MMQATQTQVASYNVMRAGLGQLTQQQKIVRFLDDHGPAIKDRIAAALGMRHSSVTARLNELVKTGEVKESDIVWNPDTHRPVTLYGVR